MAIFQPIVITNAGLSLLSQAVAGQGTLTFTSIVTSSTAIAYNPTTIQGMTSLSGVVQTAVPARALLRDGTAQVSAVFDNTGLSQGYTVNTLGLYATLGSSAQTLFAVAVASTPDNIPAPSSLPASSFYYQFNITISDTSQLTINIPEGGSLPSSVFNQMFPGIVAPDQDNDGDALVYNASSGAWGYVDTENALTTVSGSGEAVSLQKTLAGNFDQIQIFGKSIQEPTTGAQLFDLNAFAKEDEGVTINDYATGAITVNQQSNQAWDTPLSLVCPTMVAGETYLLTGQTSSTEKYATITTSSGEKQWNFGETFTPEASDLEGSFSLNCTTQTSSSGGITYYQDTFSGIMITTGSTPVPYEVYTGGVAATEPSPEYPLPIQSVGVKTSDGYEVPINACGAQLIDFDEYFGSYGSGGVYTTTSNNFAFIKMPIPAAFIGKQLTFSALIQKSEDTNSAYLIANINGDNTSYRSNYITNSNDLTLAKVTFTPQTKNDYINVSYGSGPFGSMTVKNPMLNIGNIILPYEEYIDTNSLLTFEEPLYGAPCVFGGYADTTGQQWESYLIDTKTNLLTKNCSVKIFDGSSDEGWTFAPEYNNRAAIILSYAGIASNENYQDRYGLINYFKYNKNVSMDTGNDETGYMVTKTSLFIRFGSESSVNSLTALKSWLSKNNLVCIFPLAEPTATPLTPGQVSALEALQTFNPNTNIFSGTYPAAGLSVTAQGFNLAGDLAQNLIDLQTTVQTQTKEIEALQSTVQSQGSAIAKNTEKLNTLGLVGYGRKTASQSGESISLASLIPEWSDTFTSGALYSVYFSVSFSEYDSGDTVFQPYILKSIRKGLQTTITQVELPTVYYQANSGNIIPYSCTFMIATDSDEDVSKLEFHVDGNSHNFKDMTVAVYRIR